MKENLEKFSGCTLLERQTVDLVGEGRLRNGVARDENPRGVVY